MPECELNADVLKKLYPTSNGLSVVLTDEVSEWTARYQAAKEAAKLADEAKETAQIKICSFLGECERGKSHDGRREVIWSQVNPKPKFSEQKFAIEHPDLFKAYLEQAKPYRRFSVKIKE